MIEAFLKAVHVATMVAWLGGTGAVAALAAGADPARGAALRQVALRVLTPAMLATLAIGLLLAVQGGWFRAPWLHAKLLLVLGLAGLHGVLSGRLRRLAGGEAGAVPAGWGRWVPALILLAVTAIAWLAIAKPGFR
jgi:putative membrane protein